jgi:hypothetical protein
MFCTHFAYSNIDSVATEMNATGNAVSVWQDDFYTGPYQIVASLYILGSWSSPPTVISATPTVNAQHPKVVINAAGNIIVVWNALNTVSSAFSLYGITWDSVNGWGTATQLSNNNEHVYDNYQVKLNDAGDVTIVWNAFSFVTFVSNVRAINGSFAAIIFPGTWPSPTTVSP